MAQEGIPDFDKAFAKFGEKAHEFHREISQRTGKTLNTYAREKAEIKSRKFNTLIKDELDKREGR